LLRCSGQLLDMASAPSLPELLLQMPQDNQTNKERHATSYLLSIFGEEPRMSGCISISTTMTGKQMKPGSRDAEMLPYVNTQQSGCYNYQ